MITESLSGLLPDVQFKICHHGEVVLSFLVNCDEFDLPTIILLDYKLPNITGPDVLEQLQQMARYNSVPKFVWSTSTRKQDIETCLSHGATDYFVKPISLTELIKISYTLVESFRDCLK